MRLLPSALLATLLGTTLGFAQHANSNVYRSHSGGGKNSKVHSGLPVSQHRGNPDLVGGGAGKHGVAEELAKAERQPVSQSSVTAARTKTPRLAPLPKLDLDNSAKKGKGGGIKVSGQSHKNKGLTTNSKSRRAPATGGRMR